MSSISGASQLGALTPADIGSQSRHGRYPRCSASWIVEAYSTFSGFGFRAWHVGRQKMPVVRTHA